MEERDEPYPGAEVGALADSHLGTQPPLTLPVHLQVGSLRRVLPMPLCPHALFAGLCSPGVLIRSMCGYVLAMSWYTRGLQWTTCGSCLSPFTIRVLDIELVKGPLYLLSYPAVSSCISLLNLIEHRVQV